jgi:disulfide bond formation protein DsbB
VLSDRGLRAVLAWLVIGLLAVPVGGALWLGVALGESPCILCWAQRTSMVLIALVGVFVIRYGPRPRYLGMLVLLGAWGIHMATRHSALHLARDVGQGFAMDIFGVHTYVWAWFIHWLVLLAAGLLLLLVKGPLKADPEVKPGPVGRFAMGLLVVLAGANAIQAFISTGPPPFVGQGDPIRLSLNPKHWVWSMGETGGAMSLRGRWTIPAPDPGAVDVDPDPATGPLVALPTLEVQRWLQVTAPVEGTITGLAAAPGGVPMLVTTAEHGVYFLDGTLSRVLNGVVLDPGFSIDLSPLAGATWRAPTAYGGVGPGRVGLGDTEVSAMVLSTNKSYVQLEPVPPEDPEREWRHFLETDGTVTELRRSRFATVRARLHYALSLAYDAAADEYITVSVPSPRHPELVVSRFAGDDRVLSSEFLPAVSPRLTLPPDRDLGEYVVTGAAAADGLLYAMSAAYSTLLVIDLETEQVVAAYAVPGLTDPVGLAVRGGELLVAQADGRVAVLERPMPGGGRLTATP